MKKSAKLLRLRLGVSLLCLGAWTAYPQDLKPQPEATVSAITNKLPDNASSRFTPPPLNSLEPGKTNNAQPGEITTLDGTTYKGVTVQRVDPDGLTVGYTSAGGGPSAVKIKFKNLPDDLQRQYKYDPDKAAAYEARQVQGMAVWRAQHQKEAEVAKRAAIQRAKQDAFEQQQKEELEQQQKKEQPEMTEQQKKGGAKGNRSDVVRVHIKCEGGENNQLDSIRVERKPAHNDGVTGLLTHKTVVVGRAHFA